MRLHLIRHADPDYLNNTITVAGHLEARALAKRFSIEGLDKIYCSPFGRAKDTMQYTAKALKVNPKILDWTQELPLQIPDTPWGCICAWDIPAEEFLKQPPKTRYENWHTYPWFDGFDVKEMYNNIVKNSDHFLEQHGYKREENNYLCTSPTEEKIAVFCHGGLALTWLAHLLNIPVTVMWSSFWLPTSSVTTILFDQRSDQYAVPRCLGLGDTSHLYAAGLDILPNGIKANYA